MQVLVLPGFVWCPLAELQLLKDAMKLKQAAEQRKEREAKLKRKLLRFKIACAAKQALEMGAAVSDTGSSSEDAGAEVVDGERVRRVEEDVYEEEA